MRGCEEPNPSSCSPTSVQPAETDAGGTAAAECPPAPAPLPPPPHLFPQVALLQMSGVVYLNCCSTSVMTVKQESHLKVP